MRFDSVPYPGTQVLNPGVGLKRVRSRRPRDQAPVEEARATVAATMQQIIDDLPEQIALLDDNFIIVAVNRSWADTMKSLGYTEVSPGDNFRDAVARYAAVGYDAAAKALDAFDEIASGQRVAWQMIYKGWDKWSDREFQMTMHRIVIEGLPFITITRWEISEIWELRRLKNEISSSLIEGQALERQRLARELHDSTSQLLAAVGLLLGRLKHDTKNQRRSKAIAQIQELAREAQQEIRLISYLAHPPIVEKTDFAQALGRLAEGFADRSGIPVSVSVEDGIRFSSADMQRALYRIVQEALSNVYRHASASNVTIEVHASNQVTHVVVADNGIGVGSHAQPGVGFAGMRSRLAELGARLSIRPLSPGTAIIASVRRLPNDRFEVPTIIIETKAGS